MFGRDKLRKPSEVITGPLLRTGEWAVGAVSGSLAWPNAVHEFRFRGHLIYVIPPMLGEGVTSDFYPCVAADLAGNLTFVEGQRLLAAFLSSLAWVSGQAIIGDQFSSGNLPRPPGGFKGPYVTSEGFYFPYLPEPLERKGQIALALFREGLSLNHVGYQCLSFFKILNLLIGDGKRQVAWIDQNFQNVLYRSNMADWVTGLPAGQTPGQLLYGSNRSAMAHAGGNPTIDPDDPVDRRRLFRDLPVVTALAEYAIETELGIQSAQTEFNEHLYELDGFKRLFGEDLLNRILQQPEVDVDAFPSLPSLDFKLAMKPAFASLEGMRAEVIDCANGSVGISCQSPDGLVNALVGLDFANERLVLQPHIAVGDDGSGAASRHRACCLRFEHAYVGNGILEVWASEREARLGRCSAYIPNNIDPGATERNFQRLIAEADEVVAMRVSETA